MIELDIDREKRKQRRLRQLGTNEPRCATCGEDRWQCLEQHHAEGQAHGETLIIECRNCHRHLSDAQRDHPPKLASHDPRLEAIGRLLLGIADMFAALIETLRNYGRELIARAAVKIENGI